MRFPLVDLGYGRGRPKVRTDVRLSPCRRAPAGRHVLIIVQNLPVPFDRRVWLECQALTDEGFDVSVVCPKGPGDPDDQVIDGVDIYKYRPYPGGAGMVGFLLEYVYSFLATAWLVAKVQRRRRITCCRRATPPTSSGPSACSSCRERHPVRLRPPRPVPRALRVALPRGQPPPVPGAATARVGHASQRRSRDLHQRVLPGHRHRTQSQGPGPGGRGPYRSRRRNDFGVERPTRRCGAAGSSSSPTWASWGPKTASTSWSERRTTIVHTWKRDDIAFTLIGSGDCYEELVALRDELGLGDAVEFTGRAPDELVGSHPLDRRPRSVPGSRRTRSTTCRR